MTILRTAARAAAVAAVATMTVSPVLAAVKPIPITLPLSAKPMATPGWTSADDAFQDRRWRRYRHRGNGIGGGDVLGGLLILGGIAAVAAAIDKDKQERRTDRTQGRDYPYRDGPYRQDPYDYRGRDDAARDYGRTDGQDPRAMDRAVDACSAEAARSGRVDEIFGVDRVDGEWRVRGDYADGRDFTCTVDGSGRAYVGAGDRGAANSSGDSDPEPVAQAADEDDRYATGDSPDFEDTRGR